MTNAMIIFNEAVELMENGVIGKSYKSQRIYTLMQSGKS